MVLAAAVNMRGWIGTDLLPPGDVAGYAAEVDYVRDALLRHGRVPTWCTKWFAGSTYFVNSFKQYVTFPLALSFGALAATKIMVAILKVAAAFGLYAVFARLLQAPGPGLVAGYAYAFSAVANHATGHLDVFFCYALFPLFLLASVDLLRQPRWQAALALGGVAACLLYAYYLQVLVCAVLGATLLALRPWRGQPAEANPFADPRLAAGWILGAGGALIVAAILSASSLAWLAYDGGAHALLTPAEAAAQRGLYLFHTPFLLFNRLNWLGPWLVHHLPPLASRVVDLRDPLIAQAHYVGGVAVVVSLAGWLFVRRQYSLRRWYQTMAIVLLFQYLMSLGPRTLLWQLARTFRWDETLETRLAVALTAASAACVGGALLRAWSGRRSAPGRPTGAGILLGAAGGLFLVGHSLFDIVRVVMPSLDLVRGPGHFFDVAPFSLAALFGVALVGITAGLRHLWLGRFVVPAVALLVVLDFWPSTGAFRLGTPVGPVDELRQVVAGLPAEGGSLRIELAGASYQDWVLASLVTSSAAVGVSANWTPWQAGRHWFPFTWAAATAARPDRAADADGDPYAAIARFKYRLQPASAAPPRAPWRLHAGNSLFTLWQQPTVLPMGSAFRSYVVSVGEDDLVVAAAVGRVFRRGTVIVDGGAQLAQVPPDLLAGAALLRCGPQALADPASRTLGRRYADKLIDVSDPAAADERWGTFVDEAPGPAPPPVSYTRPEPERMALEVDAGTAPAMVLVSEAYHPWWAASVDGRPVPALRAEVAFLAVAVGPGRHTIELRLLPRSPLLKCLSSREARREHRHLRRAASRGARGPGRAGSTAAGSGRDRDGLKGRDGSR
jgi:hypothetical protein